MNVVVPLAGPDFVHPLYGVRPLFEVDGRPLILTALESRPWIRFGEATGAPVRYTRSAAGVHIHALDPAAGEIALPAELSGGAARWADGSVAETTAEPGGAVVVRIPEGLHAAPVAVVTVS